jgi:4-amino-4-deoxy-L-arabinose transferase-like glycosyltransferase
VVVGFFDTLLSLDSFIHKKKLTLKNTLGNILCPMKSTFYPFRKNQVFIKILLLLVVLYIPYFHHLDAHVLRIWDEARRAFNSWEMLNNRNVFITYFNDLPDMWGTKPPLLIWIQSFFIKLFGWNELALRLPSAIAGISTALIMVYFISKYLGSNVYGVISILIMITSLGYITGDHTVRTGDYEGLLALFSTIMVFCWFLYIEVNSYKQRRYLFLFFLFLILAVYTKGIAGFFFVPGLFLHAVITGRLPGLLRDKNIYAGIALSVIIMGAYYLIRELHNPGYFKAVIVNEVTGRYFEIKEGHKGDLMFYFQNLVSGRFSNWHYLLIPGIIVGFLSKDFFIRRFIIFLLTLILSYYTIISLSKTKIIWYDYPLFPFLSMLAGYFVYFIFKKIKNFELTRLKYRHPIFSLLLLSLVFIFPYYNMYKAVTISSFEKKKKSFYRITYMLRDASYKKINLDNYNLAEYGYKAHNDFYLKKLADSDCDIKRVSAEKLGEGDSIIVYQNEIIKILDERYIYTEIKDIDGVKFLHIDSLK